MYKVDNFINGEVYNVGGKIEWEMDIKEYSNLVLKATKKNDNLVKYEKSEAFTTKVKTVDFSKSIKVLDHMIIAGEKHFSFSEEGLL